MVCGGAALDGDRLRRRCERARGLTCALTSGAPRRSSGGWLRPAAVGDSCPYHGSARRPLSPRPGSPDDCPMDYSRALGLGYRRPPSCA